MSVVPELWRASGTDRDVRGNFGIGSRKRVARLDAVLAELERAGTLSLAQLVLRTGASAATLRRDLTLLADLGALRRTHGGATLVPDGTELPVAVRDTRQREAKQRIAAAAAALIPRGRCAISLSGGSTAAAVVRQISARRDVTIVTNSLTIADLPQTYPHMRVIATGGLLRPESMELVGVIAERAFASANTEIAILGADGVDAVAGVTTHDETEARTNNAMVEKARRAIIVADASKIGKVTLARMAEITDIDIVITDDRADPDQLDALRRVGVEVIVV